MKRTLCIVALALLVGAGAGLFAQQAPDAPGFTDLVYLHVNSGSGDVQLVAAPTSGRLRLVGVFAAEDGGSVAATFSLCDGTAACANGATEVLPITLSVGQSTRSWFPPWGIPLSSGLFLDRTAGTERLTVVYRVYK